VPAAQEDGYRVLVDRLWPRGLKKEALPLDAWLRDISPSPALRKWFGHAPERWEGFVQRYRAELAHPPAKELFEQLLERARRGTVTLVFSTKDEERNSAVVLKAELEKHLRR
jgi:uncharacterized protein YeaO (DUF488 family)